MPVPGLGADRSSNVKSLPRREGTLASETQNGQDSRAATGEGESLVTNGSLLMLEQDFFRIACDRSGLSYLQPLHVGNGVGRAAGLPAPIQAAFTIRLLHDPIEQGVIRTMPIVRPRREGHVVQCVQALLLSTLHELCASISSPPSPPDSVWFRLLRVLCFERHGSGFFRHVEHGTARRQGCSKSCEKLGPLTAAAQRSATVCAQ